MTATHTAARAAPTTTPAAPGWAVLAAHVVALLPLPTTLWRLALALGFSGGYTDAGLAELDLTALGRAWILSISILSEGAALLTLGLVRGWGEVLPRWMPLLGGGTVPVRAAVTPAIAGAAVVTVLWTPFVLWWSIPHPDMTPTGSVVVGLLYLPQVLWGPLLVALTVSYARRRRSPVAVLPTVT